MAENTAGRQRHSRDSLAEIAKNTRKAATLLGTGIALPAGASTEAKQDTQITLATSMDATLTSMLSSLNSSQDMEILLVRDTGDSDIVVQQIREYDIDSGTFSAPTYQKVDGSTHTVIGPLEYLDPSAVLNLILTALQGTLDVDIVANTIGLATEVTLSSIDTDTTTIAGDTTSIDAKTPALGTAVTAASTPVNIASDQTVPVSATSLPLPTGAATEATLSTVETNTDFGTVVGGGTEATALRVTLASDSTGLVSVDDGGGSLTVDLASTIRTPSLARRTDATGSPIAAGARSVSIFNAGGANGTVLGATIKAGESFTWTAGGEEDTLSAISYDGTGTELVITTIV